MADLTKTQEWFRDYSAFLGTSYASSARVAHSTGKGDARENAILDTLRLVLPTRLSLVRHPVIIDADDREARSFDAAIANLFDYPRLFARDLDALMVESVRCAIEIKSNLDRTELDDVFQKVASLKGLRSQNADSRLTGLSVAFAYNCDNLNLRFLDFAVASDTASNDGVSLVCALNQGLFTYWTPTSSSVIPAGLPYALPYLIEAKEDTLLIFVYLLISWLDGNQEMKEFWAYIQPSIHKIPSQTFDPEFLDAVTHDVATLERARSAMRGTGDVPFSVAYAKARAAVGL